eukprot:366330-Chlamydomonas_euryale.AAC.13
MPLRPPRGRQREIPHALRVLCGHAARRRDTLETGPRPRLVSAGSAATPPLLKFGWRAAARCDFTGLPESWRWRLRRRARRRMRQAQPPPALLECMACPHVQESGCRCCRRCAVGTPSQHGAQHAPTVPRNKASPS